MEQPEHPSYAELVYRVLRAAEQPLPFEEIFTAVAKQRPITTRDPKGTIRSALTRGAQLVSTGDGRYWYLPYCIRGSLLRVLLTEKKPANQPIAIGDEVRQALWPSFFEGGNRRAERPLRARLPTGDEAILACSLAHLGEWVIPVTEPLRRYLVDHRAAAGDSLLIRVLDAEEGLGEAWFESRRDRPAAVIVLRNQQLADAAYEVMRQRSADQRPIWEIAIALLGRGVYRADAAPDPLEVVLRADPRFDFGGRLDGLGMLDGLFPDFVSLRPMPDPAAATLPVGTLYQIKVTLRGSKPPIWRRLIVPADTRLSRLHDILQVAMGWTDSHLHQFKVGRRFIGVPSPDDWTEVEDERKVRLSDVAPAARSKFQYEYDFGDSWEHEILVEKVLPPESEARAPVCLDGRRACPPEDVGGVWGYERFLQVIRDPEDPEHEEMLEWIGDEFDPEAFDAAAVTARLRPFGKHERLSSSEGRARGRRYRALGGEIESLSTNMGRNAERAASLQLPTIDATVTASRDLIERSAELKAELLEFSEKPRYKRAFEPFLEQYFPGKLVTDEAQFANLLDWFLMQHRLSDGRTLVEHFVAENRELPEREREMLLSWKDAVTGIFEVKGRDSDALVAVNLIDEMTYRLRSNAGPTVFDAMRSGSFLMTRIVPLGDEWLLSGISSTLPASARDEAYEWALDFAAHDPSLAFRNPEKLEQAWELQRQLHDAFVEFFGSDTLVVPRRELAERMTAFDRFYVFEHRGADGKTAAEHAKETHRTVPEPPTFTLPDDMAPGETIGILSDAKEGIQYLADFGRAEETFANPSLAADPAHRDIVLTYLEDDSVPPLALRRLAERGPERASEVFRQVLKKPRFSWGKDGEALLRRHKKSFYERPLLPSVTPLSDELTRAQMAASSGSARPRHRSQPGGRTKRRVKRRSGRSQ